MAPKTLSNTQPSKKKEEKEQLYYSEEIDEQESEEEKEEENSSGEEEEALSEGEEEDQENEINKTSIPPPKTLSKSIAQENGSDSEPESDDSPSDYKLQPIPKTSTTTAKRTQQQINNSQHSLKSNKRIKTEEKISASAVSSIPGGTGCITRLWCDGDEIALLNCLIEFKNLKDTDKGAFCDNIKGKLQVDFSRDQLRTKIKRMKTRFLNALKRGENGMDPVFSKPHDLKAFELSKKIWGDEVENSEGNKNDASYGVREKSKKDIVKTENIVKGEKEILENEKDGEEALMWSKYPFFSASFNDVIGKFPSLEMSDAGMSAVKEKFSLIGNVKAKELNEKWKQMLVEETELHYKMLTLMKEQMKLVLDQ